MDVGRRPTVEGPMGPLGVEPRGVASPVPLDRADRAVEEERSGGLVLERAEEAVDQGDRSSPPHGSEATPDSQPTQDALEGGSGELRSVVRDDPRGSADGG